MLNFQAFNSDNVLVRSDGKPYAVKWVNRKFSEFLEKYHFPHIRYHDLRHLNASVLLTVMPAADVSKHLGHSNTNTTTRIYAHVLKKERNAVASKLDNIFKADSSLDFSKSKGDNLYVFRNPQTETITIISTGTKKQIEQFVDDFEHFYDSMIMSVSIPYQNTRKVKYSQECRCEPTEIRTLLRK